MIARLALSLFLLLPGGCIFLYVPDPGRAATRGTIDKRDLKPFTIGGTTREEVLLALGEPDVVGEDGDALMYWWCHSRGFLLWAVVGPGAGGGYAGMVGKRIHLCFKFDRESRILRHKFVHLPEAAAIDQAVMLSQW
jgi:hypothetical protein